MEANVSGKGLDPRRVFARSEPAGQRFMWGEGRGGRPHKLGRAPGAATFSDVLAAQPLVLTKAERSGVWPSRPLGSY